MKSQSRFTKMVTSGLIVEHRCPGVALSVDLASHISHRHSMGTIAVVTSHPKALMSSVRKQWLKLIRRAQRDKSSTLNRQHIASLDELIRVMQAISFTARDPADELSAYVSFATVEQFIAAPPQCTTLYVTEPIPKLSQHMIVSWMPRSGQIVMYEQR